MDSLIHLAWERGGGGVFVCSLQSRVRSALVGYPKMGSNTLSRAANSEWNSSGFMAGREGTSSAAKRVQSRKDGLYHKIMGRNLTAIMKSNSCW